MSLIDWREGDQVKEVTATNRERYNVFMTNLVTARYDQEVREEAQRKAQELVKQIPVTMGKDRSGLPVIMLVRNTMYCGSVYRTFYLRWASRLKSAASHKVR